MPPPKVLLDSLDAKDVLDKCSRKCISKDYKRALAELNAKYEAKRVSLMNDLRKNKLNPKDFVRMSDEIKEQMRMDMKNTQEFVKYYQCVIDTCKTDLDKFRASMIAWLKYTSEEAKVIIAQHGQNESYFKGVLVNNKKRIKLLQKAPSVPSLIDILIV